MMKEEDRERIKELLGEVECPKAFKCAASGFRYLCQVKAGGENKQLICRDDNPNQCVFANPSNGDFLCDCPLRRYLFEKLNL